MNAKWVKDYLESTEIGPRLKHFSPELSDADIHEVLGSTS